MKSFGHCMRFTIAALFRTAPQNFCTVPTTSGTRRFCLLSWGLVDALHGHEMMASWVGLPKQVRGQTSGWHVVSKRKRVGRRDQ